METKTIGERIRYARKLKNLTISEMKNLTSISTGNLSELENDVTKPSSNALIQFKKVLGVSIDWILLGEEGNLDESSNKIQPYFSEKDLELIKNYNLLSEDRKRDIEGFINVSLNSCKND
jgi:transcriptional regulator with XRE-family HTH domain